MFVYSLCCPWKAMVKGGKASVCFEVLLIHLKDHGFGETPPTLRSLQILPFTHNTHISSISEKLPSLAKAAPLSWSQRPGSAVLVTPGTPSPSIPRVLGHGTRLAGRLNSAGPSSFAGN